MVADRKDALWRRKIGKPWRFAWQHFVYTDYSTPDKFRVMACDFITLAKRFRCIHAYAFYFQLLFIYNIINPRRKHLILTEKAQLSICTCTNYHTKSKTSHNPMHNKVTWLYKSIQIQIASTAHCNNFSKVFTHSAFTLAKFPHRYSEYYSDTGKEHYHPTIYNTLLNSNPKCILLFTLFSSTMNKLKAVRRMPGTSPSPTYSSSSSSYSINTVRHNERMHT